PRAALSPDRRSAARAAAGRRRTRSSSQQPFDDGFPGHALGAVGLQSRLAERASTAAIGVERVELVRDRLRVGLHHEAVDAVFDELDGTAAVAAGDHRLARQERFQSDEAVVLAQRPEEHGERTGVVADLLVVTDLSEE